MLLQCNLSKVLLFAIGMHVQRTIYCLKSPSLDQVLSIQHQQDYLCLSHNSIGLHQSVFESCLNPLCTSNSEGEPTTHFFLHCHHFNAIHITLNNSLKSIDKDILKLSDSSLTKVILFDDSKYSDIQNHDILNLTVTYIIDSRCFGCSLL